MENRYRIIGNGTRKDGYNGDVASCLVEWDAKTGAIMVNHGRGRFRFNDHAYDSELAAVDALGATIAAGGIGADWIRFAARVSLRELARGVDYCEFFHGLPREVLYRVIRGEASLV